MTDLQRAVRWSAASVVWTVLASVIAVVAGIAAGSLLLVAFGAVGALDAAGSLVLVFHFRHALHHEAVSATSERRALVAIACGMAVIAMVTGIESARRLLDGAHVESTAIGITIAIASTFVLAALARGKQRVGSAIDSRALVADAHVSAMGAAFAVFTVVGTLAAANLDWWWVDAIGSLAVAAIALVVASGHARHASAS